MSTKKKAPSAASARHARSLKKYTPEEVAQKMKALPPVDQKKFEDVLRRLVTTPPPKGRAK